MQIFYCERCGLRIAQDDLNSGRAQLQGENSALCAACLAQTVSAAASAPLAPFAPPHSSAHAITSVSARASVSTRNSARTAQAGKPAYSHLQTALLAAGGLLLVAIVAVALSGRSSTADASPRAVAHAPTPAIASSPSQGQATVKSVVPESVPAPAVSAQQSAPALMKQEGPAKAHTQTMEDFREGYAARRWADLKAAKTGGGDWDLAIRVREFARTYASTNAGREAAEALKAALGAETFSPANSVAAYRRDFKPQQPATGWSYLWNADGALGNAANYKPLIWNAGRSQYCGHATTFPCAKPVAYTGASADKVHPGTGIEQGQPFDRYLIAAYTLQPGQQGHFVLSVLAKRLGGSHGSIEIQVFVNDAPKGRISGTGDDLTGPLGALKPGDTVYVALGPNRNDGSDSSEFDFTLFKID